MLGGSLSFSTLYRFLTAQRAEGLSQGAFGAWLLLAIAFCLPVTAIGVMLLKDGWPEDDTDAL
jgi:hypothetical protein